MGTQRADLLKQDWDPPDTRNERQEQRAKEHKTTLQSSGMLSLGEGLQIGLGLLLRAGGHPMGISGPAKPQSSE